MTMDKTWFKPSKTVENYKKVKNKTLFLIQTNIPIPQDLLKRDNKIPTWLLLQHQDDFED